MTTMTIDQLFPLRRKDVLTADTQMADGSVGVIQAIKLPSELLKELSIPAEGLEAQERKALRLSTLIAHLASIVRTPSLYLHGPEDYDPLNPLNAYNVDNFLDFELMNNLADVFKERLNALHEGNKEQDMYLVAYTSKEKFLSSLAGFAPREFDLDFGTALIANLEDAIKHNTGEEFVVTQYHFLDGALVSMNLSPFHSTDFREYNPLFNLSETDVDPRLLTGVDEDIREEMRKMEQAFKSFDAVSESLKDADPNTISEKLIHALLGQLDDEDKKSFLVHTLKMMGQEVSKGNVNDPDVMTATIDAFIELVRDDKDFPLDFNDPIGQFSEEVLHIGRSKRRIYHVRLNGDHDKEMFVFSDCETSLGFSLRHTNEGADTFVIPESHILELEQGVNMSELESMEERSKERFNRRIPLSEIEGINDATEKIGQVLVHSLVISFFAALSDRD